MNVIVSNRQKEIIDNANIDAIKDLNGLFNVDDLINKFKNYFFSKMILDATSVVNFASREVLTTLVNEIGAEKLIILLPSDPEPPMEFKKLLIELKIYNYTNKIEDVVKFIENPNTYEDAIKTIDNSFGNNMYVDNSIKENDNNNNNNENNNNFSNNDMNTENNGFVDNNGNNGLANNFNNMNGNPNHRSLGDMLNNFDLQNSSNTNTNSEPEEKSDINYSVENNDMPNDNEVRNETEEKINYDLNNNNDEPQDNTSGNTFLISGSIDDSNYTGPKVNKIVIGVKNVTLHAGSTSLIYMMHKMASVTLKKKVLSIELDKKDFKLYRDSKMISIDSKDVQNAIDNSNDEIIFVDLNGYEDTSFCTDVIYLVEPSTIKLNKLMVENKDVFKELRNKKVVINKSLLSNSDVRTLASEAGMNFFFGIEPLNDRIFNDAIIKLLDLLGIK